MFIMYRYNVMLKYSKKALVNTGQGAWPGLAGIAVGSMYVAKYFPKESKEAVSDMVELIR